MRNPVMQMVAQRNFVDQLALQSAAGEEALQKNGGEVDLWRQQQQKESTALALHSRDEIEKYVLSITRNYFRTTRKATVGLESNFADHGLDSLDVIELVIQVEDELGYLIDGENLEKFKKPKHFVNFISQLDSYRKEHSRLPHEQTKAAWNWKEIFPTK